MLVEMALVLLVGSRASARTAPAPAPRRRHSNTKALGQLLYTDYVYPFEIAAVILLVAIVAAIALTLRKRKETKHQDPAQQIRVRREDRVRIVKMPSEKPPADAAALTRSAQAATRIRSREGA